MSAGDTPRRLNVVVGVTGGIAAYKAVGIVRAFVLAGHDVHVVATENALRFVGRPTLEAISRNLVQSDLYEGVAEVKHVAIGQAADLIVVAPATANSIAKLAGGFADDVLGNTILASTAPVVIAPAMHTEMWQNPATQANVQLLRDRGVVIVGPAVGQLTGADSGPGRMSDVDDIVAAALGTVTAQDLVGRRILVTAGGTREPLDPVRFIGNRSSGRQGVAIAIAAAARGAEVTLIAANLEVESPASIRVIGVGTTAELAESVATEAQTHDVVIMAAAVADYRPEHVAESKIKKDTQGNALTLRLVRNPDILKSIAEHRLPGQLIVGFAAETEPDDAKLLAIGREKITRKGSDLLIINRVGWTEGFATQNNTISVIDSSGTIVSEATGTKLSVANRILDLVSAR
ncbi:MAG: bifunctional phosphopantothenoylcysteine decarboxylase/phosphopantothenate--cysteine ligase CoaBC [Rhodoglobus sp.]